MPQTKEITNKSALENYTYVGFDLSTQKLKAVQMDNSLNTLATAEVQFDSDLPEFRTSGGTNVGFHKNEFFVHPLMWIKAVDIIMDRLVVNGADLSSVMAISGSAQQHGIVFWSEIGVRALKHLDANKFLHQQVNDAAFALSRTPIWMDGSAKRQCLEMETAIGGCSEMVKITGSKCYARFSGPQIRKVYQTHTNAYENTKRISLVSSFLASIFLGDIAPIDYADASGMNLFDIRKKTWSKACLNACAPDLEERLGTPVKTCSILGFISNFFVQRFGIPSTCSVTAFTGDNPSSLSGMYVEKDWLVMSLGTSDTIMMTLPEPLFVEEGHILCHPTDGEQFMGLLCFRNGSLVRDAVKRMEAQDSWLIFNELLDSTPRGNYGNMALHFHTKEITPNVQGVIRWNKDCNIKWPTKEAGVVKFSSPQTEIRALIEGQMLHRRAVITDMGFNIDDVTNIIATGGASVNKSILQVIADVFNAPIYVQKISEAALLGAAYRAKYALYVKEVASENEVPLTYQDFIAAFIRDHLVCVCMPSKDNHKIYNPMLNRYRDMIKVLKSQQ